MSLVSWLNQGKGDTPLLPPATVAVTTAANKEVEKADSKKSRKRGSYNCYNDETHAEITKYSCEHGNKTDAVKFSRDLGHTVTESMVRNMKKAFLIVQEVGHYCLEIMIMM